MTITLASLVRPRGCFYCIDLRLAVIAIGIWEFLLGLIEVLNYRTWCVFTIAKFVKESRYLINFMPTHFWIVPPVTSCGVAILLLIGVGKVKKFLIEIYVVTHFLVNVIMVIGLIVALIINCIRQFEVYTIIVVTILFVVFCLDTYLTIIVNSYLQKLNNDEDEKKKQKAALGAYPNLEEVDVQSDNRY